MKVGFIGLGIMGKPMAKNVVKAGHEVTVYDFLDAPFSGCEPGAIEGTIFHMNDEGVYI